MQTKQKANLVASVVASGWRRWGGEGNRATKWRCGTFGEQDMFVILIVVMDSYKYNTRVK